MATNGQSYHLPPVSEVFKMVNEVETQQNVQQHQVEAAVTRVHSTGRPSSAASSGPEFAALDPTATDVQPSSQDREADLSHDQQADLVQPSSNQPSSPDLSESWGTDNPDTISTLSENPEKDPSGVHDISHPKPPSKNPAELNAVPDASHPTESKSHSQKEPIPWSPSRLVLICAIMGGLLVFALLGYIAVRKGLFAICAGWRKRKEESEAWTKIDSPSSSGTYQDAEKEIVYTVPSAPSSQRSASSVYSTCETGGSILRADSTVPDEVIDISYPRSKFSVSSSEYPISIRSQSSTQSALAVPVNVIDRSSYVFEYHPPGPLEDPRHSKALSEPIVSPDIEQGSCELLRAIQHRRSRSVSGLAYTVQAQGQRESESTTAGVWSESPQSPKGWLHW
ncbi:hypothetical protein H0H93_005291 [Arthromyces matolae]|nr:hypothetical protein H0H93_005291 [Arthromyces matolae]